MIYALIGYMWLYIHRPFEIWPALATFRVERVYMLLTLALWAGSPKSWTKNRVNYGVGLLAASILISAALSPYEGLSSIAVENWLKVALFYVLLMTSVRSLAELKIVVVAFVAIIGLYELHSLREYSCGRGVFRMGIWRMIGVDVAMADPNTFAASAIYGLPLLLAVWQLATTRWLKRLVWLLFGLGLLCIVLTGSRTAFLAITVSSFVLLMKSAKRWRYLCLLLVCGAAVWMSLPDSLKDRYLTIVDPSRGPANAEVSAQSREQFFIMAIEIWQESPLFGVGPRGFAYASGTGVQSHSLYAETLSELGILGAIALAVLISGLFGNLREAKSLFQQSAQNSDDRFCFLTVNATWIATLLLLFMGLGGHNLFRFTWLWYGAFSALAVRFLREAHAEHSANYGTLAR